MDALRLVLLVTFAGAGVLFVGLSIPLIRGRVRPNPWYGLRVKRTLADPSIWYPANRYAGWWLLGAGAAEAAVTLALYAMPGLNAVGYAVACVAVLLAGVV